MTRARAVLVALSGLLLLASPLGAPRSAEAAVSRVYVESAVIEPGATVELDVIFEATAPGVGAWNIDLQFDRSLVTLKYVTPVTGFCSPSFDVDTARMVGASESGFTGTILLCTLRFAGGDDLGEADLDLTINQLTDPSGQDLSVSAEDGSITIAEATPTPSPSPTPSPTPVPTAVPTATPAVVPAAGGPPSPSATPIALLVAAGTVIAAAGAWILQRIRQP